jgi:hypothetical protein
MTNYIPFYTHSLDNARHCCEVEKWRASHKANIECAKAIENSISDNFKDNHFNSDTVKSIIEKFGFDRVNFILRYNLKNSQHDERYSKENLKWSESLYAPSSNMRTDYLINSHPVLLNAFVDRLRNEWANLNLWDSTHCIDKTEIDFKGKILVIFPSRLNDKYKTPDDQLFYATDGFGCSPTSIGRAVYGYFVKDNEYCSWSRSDFIGVLKDEFIPNWVKEKYNISNNIKKYDENCNNNLSEIEEFEQSM